MPAALFLVRAGYDAGKRRFPYTLGGRLPAADTLERLTFRLHAFAFPIWTFAIICGAIWAEAAWGRYWGWDPKEIWSFISWVAYAAYLHARATPEREADHRDLVRGGGLGHHADQPVRDQLRRGRPALLRPRGSN